MAIDLRSDTVTRPTEGMLRAMSEAEVGDDVFGEDPTANALQQTVAGLFGFEAGLFVPSGVMSNQLSLKVQTSPGDEIIIDETGHVYNYETAAASLISSVQIHPVAGSRGKLSGERVRSALRAGHDWEPRSRLVVIENSTNKGGGACYTRGELLDVKETADEFGLGVHLDGARIWNAVTATDLEPEFFGTVADTMTVSFSKGLGAPVGSMMLSSGERIRRARRYRKMLGGGMRQIGVLAAAADYAIEHHWPLLEEDHRRARELAETIEACSGLSVDPESVETNILLFDVLDGEVAAALEKLEEEGIRMVPFGPKTIRATFHFEIDDEDLEKTKSVVAGLFA